MRYMNMRYMNMRCYLYQVGEYQLQDAFLSDPFSVNASYVMNAYTCFARTTGCRPGMAVNDVKDFDDPAGHWYEVPPLQMGSLAISPEALRQVVQSLTDEHVQMMLRMEITFERKKGEYFACYDFGTAITPDSDEMVRVGTLAMIRLQLVTASYAACYAKLGEAAAAALRCEVANPDGFVGLAIERTGYESWGQVVEACRLSGWALDVAAYDRPLFPGVHEKTGKFLFTESFLVQRLCKRLIDTGRRLGFNKHGVGAWSLRKDATEVVAKSGKGEVAARVLGHRHVNSRTMDRVYRADLRCRDLGAYWTGREEVCAGAPLTCLSARRVPEAGGVLSMADVPAGPERKVVEVKTRDSTQALDVKARALEGRLGAGRFGVKGWKKRARELGCESDVTAYEEAKKRHNMVKVAAEHDAVDAFQLRSYREGQQKMRQDKAHQVAMLATHAWTPRSEDVAMAFGLDRVWARSGARNKEVNIW